MKNLLAYLLIGIGIYIFVVLSFLFFKDFLKFGVTFIFTILILISMIPLFVYLAFFTKEDGAKGGIVGYYLIKLLRRLR